MKKLIGTLAMAALIASAAFAEINFGSWLRGVYAPVAFDGNNAKTGMSNSWGGYARTSRVNIDMVSEDGKAGIATGVYWDNDTAKWGDNNVMWVKPVDMLRVSLGHRDYTDFRGDLCFGSWNWLRPNNWLFGDEGLTFDQLGNLAGIQLELTPIEGLVIMWNLPLYKQVSEGVDAYKPFEEQHIAAKYTINDIGTIKLGWYGQGKRVRYIEDINAKGDWKAINYAADNLGADEKYLGDINVAFDLTAVENLWLTIGAKIAIASSDYKKGYFQYNAEKPQDFQNIKLALGASYQILDNLSVAASFATALYENLDPAFQFGIGLNYGITDALSLCADFRGLIPGGYDKDGVKYEPDPDFSFIVGLQYNCSSNGYIGIGFQGFIAGKESTTAGGSVFPVKKDHFGFAIPIAVSVYF